MHITTVHTLTFTIRCVNNEQQTAAMAIIKTGASNMGLTVNVMNMPMPDGADPGNRNSSIQAMSDDRDECERYWDEVQRALALVGVDVTSP